MSKLLQVEFNNEILSDYFKVTNVLKKVSSSLSPRYKSRMDEKGIEFLGTSSGVTSIVMGYVIDEKYKENSSKITEILNVSEPKILKLSDKPNHFYIAYPILENDVINFEYKEFGTITWEIPDGIAYSIQEYLFSNQNTSNDLLDYIVIDNPGTESMDLELEASFDSDNGFIGIESEDGSVRALFGDMEEVDGFDYQESDRLFNDHFYSDPNWTANEGVVPPVASNMRQQGSFQYVQESTGEGFARVNNYGTAGPTWTGPSLTKTVPADVNGEYAKNWTASFRTDFNTDGAGSSQSRARNVGHQSITFIDQNNRIIVSVVIEDNTSTAERSDLAIYVGTRRVYDSRNTTSYYVTARPREANHIKVEKIGNTITVELAFINKKLSFTAQHADAELRKVTFYAARFGVHQPMHNNLIRALNVVKHNVEKWEDIPNKFKEGDILKYGKGGRNVFCLVNDMNELRMRDVGSTLISAPPGQSRLYLAYSDFSETPHVKVKGRAKYV